MNDILDSPFVENKNDRYTKWSFKYAILNILSFCLLVVLELYKSPLLMNFEWDSLNKVYLLNGIIFLLFLTFLASGIINTYNAFLSVKNNEQRSLKKMVGIFWGVVSTMIMLWVIGLILVKG